MKKIFAVIVLLFAASTSFADLNNCQNLYVGRIWLEAGYGGLYGVVLLNHPSDSSGSYWVRFANLTADEKKATLTLLTTAKLAQHRVNIATLGTAECGITQGEYNLKSIYLANSP
jgi:hypothetical protein